MKNKVVLFDIDYTLFNVGKYREIVFDRLQELLPQIPHVAEIAMLSYEEIRKEGWFEIEKFTKQFLTHVATEKRPKIFEDVWKDPKLLSAALYPEALNVLTTLNKNSVTLGIFSSGVSSFQKSKITKLAHFFKEEHIHIHKLKDRKISGIVKKYHGKKIILIDDYIPVITHVKKANAAITAIWIKRGKLAEKVAPSDIHPPDYTIETLDKALPIIDAV